MSVHILHSDDERSRWISTFARTCADGSPADHAQFIAWCDVLNERKRSEPATMMVAYLESVDEMLAEIEDLAHAMCCEVDPTLEDTARIRTLARLARERLTEAKT